MSYWNQTTPKFLSLNARLLTAALAALIVFMRVDSPSALAQDAVEVQVIDARIFDAPAIGAQAVQVQAVEIQAVEVRADDIINGVIAIDPAKRDPVAAKKALIEELRPILHAELYFLFLVTDIDAENKKIIKEAAEERLNSFENMLINENVFNGLAMGFNTSKVVAQTAGGLSLNANPYTRIQNELKTIVQQHAGDTQAAQYTREIEGRLEFRREAIVGMVVQLLDKRLSLSVEQREQIQSNLLLKWKDIENTSIDMYLHNNDYVPVLPFPLIDRVLNRDQRTIWKTLNQYHFPMTLQSNRFVVDWEF